MGFTMFGVQNVCTNGIKILMSVILIKLLAGILWGACLLFRTIMQYKWELLQRLCTFFKKINLFTEKTILLFFFFFLIAHTNI
jgi:hypothetical protein